MVTTKFTGQQTDIPEPMSKTTVYPTASICKKLESNNLFKMHFSCEFIQHNVGTGHKIPYDVQSNSIQFYLEMK